MFQNKIKIKVLETFRVLEIILRIYMVDCNNLKYAHYAYLKIHSLSENTPLCHVVHISTME